MIPDDPALIDDTSGHRYWANSKAFAIAGITRKTPNPENGIIERDNSGEPTGILRESAADLVKTHIPKPTAQAARAALEWALSNMLYFRHHLVHRGGGRLLCRGGPRA